MISGIWFFSLLEVVLCVKYLIQLILRFKIPFLDDNFEKLSEKSHFSTLIAFFSKCDFLKLRQRYLNEFLSKLYEIAHDCSLWLDALTELGFCTNYDPLLRYYTFKCIIKGA